MISKKSPAMNPARSFTTDDEEQYDPAADAHKLQQSSEDEEEQEDEEEGLYPEEGDGKEKEEDEDQRREEPEDPGTEDEETTEKDDAKQNSGIDNPLDDSSASSTDPFTAETEVGGVTVKTSEAISVYVRPPTAIEIVNSTEYARLHDSVHQLALPFLLPRLPFALALLLCSFGVGRNNRRFVQGDR